MNTTIERIRKKTIVNESNCWIWQGATSRGYGLIKIEGKMKAVHRISYFVFIGEIAEGKELHHTCGEKRCANPDHLQPLDKASHASLGDIGALHRGKTHCKWGHEFDSANTYVTKTGGRRCRACVKHRVKEHFERHPEAYQRRLEVTEVWARANPDKRREIKKRFRERNREKCLAYERAYRARKKQSSGGPAPS